MVKFTDLFVCENLILQVSFYYYLKVCNSYSNGLLISCNSNLIGNFFSVEYLATPSALLTIDMGRV